MVMLRSGMERSPPWAYRIVVEGPSADRRAASGVDTNGANDRRAAVTAGDRVGRP